jgi:hypothetical protein
MAQLAGAVYDSSAWLLLHNAPRDLPAADTAPAAR